MAEHRTFTLAHSAEMVGIKAATLRRWADYHSEYLSTTANPLAGQPRRFTNRDIEILKYVVDLRSQGLTVGDINSQLSTLTFPDVDTTEEPAGPGADNAELATVDAQETPGQTQALIMVVQGVESRIAAVERSQRQGYVTAIGIGICIGLLFMLCLIALASLYGTP